MKPLVMLLMLPVAALAVACDVQQIELGKSADASATPTFPVDDVDALGDLEVEADELCEDEALSLAFEQQGQRFVFELDLTEGATLSVETHGELPTDPVLAIYRPLADDGDGYETEPVATDDDSGERLHARLDQVSIDRTGSWLVGVTTHGGDSIGTVTVTAEVDAGGLCGEDQVICCLADPSAPLVEAEYDLSERDECLEDGGAEVSHELCSTEVGCCAIGDDAGEIEISTCAQAGGQVVDGDACEDFDADVQVCCELAAFAAEMSFRDCVRSLGAPDEEACTDDGAPDEEDGGTDEDDGATDEDDEPTGDDDDD